MIVKKDSKIEEINLCKKTYKGLCWLLLIWNGHWAKHSNVKEKLSVKFYLKPHVRDKRLYGTLTSGLCWSPWLIPHNVLLNAQNAGSADKRTRPWVHPRSSVFHRPIQYGRPNYIREYTREPGFEPYMQQGCCIQRLFDTLANHRTHNTSPHYHFDWRMGIGCAMAAERWVWTNEKPYFCYVEISALLTLLTRGIRTQTNFTSEWSTKDRG